MRRRTTAFNLRPFASEASQTGGFDWHTLRLAESPWGRGGRTDSWNEANGTRNDETGPSASTIARPTRKAPTNLIDFAEPSRLTTSSMRTPIAASRRVIGPTKKSRTANPRRLRLAAQVVIEPLSVCCTTLSISRMWLCSETTIGLSAGGVSVG